MTARKESFYSNFNDFITAVSAERSRRGKRMEAWLSATSAVLGLGTIMAIMGVGGAGIAALGGLGIGLAAFTGPIGWAALGVGAATTAIAARKLVRSLSEQADKQETEQLRRKLEVAKRIHDELKIVRLSEKSLAEAEVEALFNDLVEDRPIH